MHYQPLTETDKTQILKELGVSSFERLLEGIPASLKNPSFKVPEALSELEIQRLFQEIGKKNKTTRDHLSFLGGGSYEHFIPAAVHSVISRHEFYTAYTPYQPEASQGSLQAIFEFQSLVTELMGLEVSNASHYDGSTSLAEAAILALRHTGRYKILIARSVHPHYRQVLKTYLEGTSFKVEEIPFGLAGEFDKKALEQALNSEIAAVIFQTPNFLGTIEDLTGVAEKVHQAGAMLILSANPLSLGVLKAPGEWGADIGVAEGQPLGIPLHLGGPYLGLFATTRQLMRKIPGRLAGLTQDADGKRAFCLTLQAREQHIRREKASSNICTNQALCALAACVYMALLGKSGIKEIGEINRDRAAYLYSRISPLKGFEVLPGQSFFNEFVIKVKGDSAALEKELLNKNIFPGIQLGQYYPELKNHLLVCATETKTKEDLDTFVKELKNADF